MTEENRNSIQQYLSHPDGSFDKYMTTVIGHRSLKDFLLYELIMMFITPIPGKSGNALRNLFYPILFDRLGSSCSFGQNMTIQRAARIQIGNNVDLGNDTTLSLKKDGQKIIIANDVRVGQQSILNCLGGELVIGKETVIGISCRLGSYEGLQVGEKCIIGDNCYISGATHSFSRTDIPVIEQPLISNGAITIGDRVTVGRDVTILTGVTIGNDVTISDGSLVNADIPEKVNIAGVPAKKILESDE